jgi:hypothetical protein
MELRSNARRFAAHTPLHGKHGYEAMTKLFAALNNARSIVRVISAILPRIIEGLTGAILQSD